jgi:RNA polymerase sigma factor (sigma-70 family)
MSQRLLIPSAGEGPDDGGGPGGLRDVQAFLAARRLGVPVDPRWRAAWERFYQTHHPRIERVVRGFGLPETDTNDCMQDIWRNVLTVLPRFRHDPARGRLETWLDRVATNGAIDAVRRRNRRLVRPFGELGLDAYPDLAVAQGEPGDEAGAAGAEVGVAELRAAVLRVEVKLTPLNRRILRSRLLEGRSVAFVSEETGLNHNQICTRCTRLKRKLLKEIRRGRNRLC